MVRLLRLKGCGQMKKIKQPYLYIFLWMLGLFLIASVILPQNTPPAAAIASNSTDIEILNNGWKNGNDQSISSRDVNQKYFTRKLTLPAITKDTLLVIRNSYRGIQILIDQDVRLDYGFSSDNTSLLGNVFVRLPLTPADSRKELTLNFKNNYAKLTSEIEYPMLVSASSFSYYILRQNAGVVLTVISLFLLVAVMLLLIIWLKNRSFWLSKTSLYSLVIFIFLTAIWLLSDSPVLQIYISGSLRIVLLSFCSFMLMPIPLLTFINDALKQPHPLLYVLQLVLLGNIILQCILQQIGVLDFIQMLSVTHILMIISIVAILYVLLREVRLYKTDYARNILLAFFILSLFSTIALIVFYINPMSNYNMFFRIGLLLFIVMLSCFSFHKIYLVSQEQEQLQFYRQLAYTDAMTKVRNRSAFEQVRNRIADTGSDASMTVFMFDINNLKHTNDTYGHQAGDDIIQRAAELLHTVFHDIGQLYRIGGDEFLVISERNFTSPQALYALLDQKLEEYNKTAEYPLTIAKGYASNSRHEKGIDELLELADQAMYEDKRKNRKKNP